MKNKDRIENRVISPHLWKKGLGTRVRNVLYYSNINNREKLMEALGNGTWDDYNKSSLRKARNFGRKSWRELCAWAGLRMPRLPRPLKMTKSPCPHCQGRGWVKHWEK